MGHTFHKCFVYIDSFDWSAPERQYIGFKKQDLREYIKKHPMPPNSYYTSTKELVDEMLNCHGVITLQVKETDEKAFIEWYEGLIAYGR